MDDVNPTEDRGKSRRRDLLAGLAGLGAHVQRQRTDADVHAEVRRGLFALGLHSSFVVPDAGELRVEWTEDGTEVPLLQQALGVPIIGLRRPMTAVALRIWTEGAAFIDDWPTEAERFVGAPIGQVIRALPPPGAFSHAVSVRIEVGGAPIGILTATGEWPRPEDLAAFRLFGTQISSAFDAARSIAALQARNADLLALNRLADTVSNAPDVAAMLSEAESVFREAAGVQGFAILLVDDDQDTARLVHASRLIPEVLAELQRMPLDHPWLRSVVVDGQPACVPSEELRPTIAAPLAREGLRSVASVPLRFRAGTLGFVAVDFREPASEARLRVPLLQAMATHLAAGLESHRLLDDLRGRVAELTLLNDIAVATGALDPLLLVENAVRRIAGTLRAEVAATYLLEGGRLQLRATHGIPPASLERLRALGGESAIAALAFEREAPVRSPPSLMDDARRRWFQEELGITSAIAVPLMSKDRALGAIVLGRREGASFGSAAEARLLSAVGAQLGMAVENARLFADTQRRISDLEAVNSLALRVFTTAPGDSAKLLDATCREIADALRARAAAILRLDDSGRRLVAVAAWGAPLPAAQLSVDVERTPIAAEALRAQEPAWAEEVVLGASDGAAPPPMSVLFVPLTSRSTTRGLVAVADVPARRFGEAEIALAYALASEAAMALENTELYGEAQRRVAELSRLNEENERLYADLRRSYADLARAQEQLIHQERLAALGQLAAVVAHEVRNPLAVIFNSLGALRRHVRPAGDAKMLFDIVGEEADRLNRIVGDLLDFARPPTPFLVPERLERVLDDAASAALSNGAEHIRLDRDVPADLPPVPMDAHLMRQAVLNVMANAVQAMPTGGTLTVRARVDGDAARLEIGDTGVGIPEEVRHRIFEPFFTTRPTGTGLGLAVVKRILDDHRASVEVEHLDHGGTRFVIRVPLDREPVEKRGPLWSI